MNEAGEIDDPNEVLEIAIGILETGISKLLLYYLLTCEKQTLSHKDIVNKMVNLVLHEVEETLEHFFTLPEEERIGYLLEIKTDFLEIFAK